MAYPNELKQETDELAPPTEECVVCGTETPYVRALTQTTKDFRGGTFSVEHHYWKCRECGVAVLGDAEMDEAMLATVTAYQSSPPLQGSEILLDS